MIVYLHDSYYIGGVADFLEWALMKFKYVDNIHRSIYQQKADLELAQCINNTKGRSIIGLEIGSGDKNCEVKTVWIELFEDVCPKTCANFKALCVGHERIGESKTKLSYVGTSFNRIIKGSFVQGGNIRGWTKDSKIKGFSSFEQGEFFDESFEVKHDTPGLVGMCRRNNLPNTNECQFYVTTASPLTHLDGLQVIFGRVIKGLDTFRAMNDLSTQNQVPHEMIKIVKAGPVTMGKEKEQEKAKEVPAKTAKKVQMGDKPAESDEDDFQDVIDRYKKQQTRKHQQFVSDLHADEESDGGLGTDSEPADDGVQKEKPVVKKAVVKEVAKDKPKESAKPVVKDVKDAKEKAVSK